MDMAFTKEAWGTLKAYFEAAYLQMGDLELQGYGRVRMGDDGPICYEIGIPEQEVSVAKADVTWDQMLEFLQEKIDFKNVRKAKLEVPSWRLWWHTHGKGGFTVDYSNTDEETIRALAAEAGDHMWGLVFHTDTMASTLYLVAQKPIALYATLGKAICEEEEIDIPDSILEEVALKVSKKLYVPVRKVTPVAKTYLHSLGCLCLSCGEDLVNELPEAAEPPEPMDYS